MPLTSIEICAGAGGAALGLERAGSVGEQSIVIKNIDPDAYHDARDLNIGSEVAAVGLVADEHGSGYWLRAEGLFSASRPTKV